MLQDKPLELSRMFGDKICDCHLLVASVQYEANQHLQEARLFILYNHFGKSVKKKRERN